MYQHPAPRSSHFPAWLFDLIQAPIRWQIVHLAFKHDLFDALSNPTNVDMLASQTGFDTQRLTLYLNALVALGLVCKQNGAFSLNPEFAPFLQADSDLSLRDMALSLSDLRHDDIASLLQNTETGLLPNMQSADHWDKSARSLQAFHRTMAADAMLNCLERLPEWADIRHIVDIGAGSATLAQRITDKYPNKNVTILDLPPLAKRMGNAISQSTASAGRINILAGDFNDTDIPQNVDLIWASMTLYYARNLVDVLIRWRRSLATGGLFVSLHEELLDERTAPEAHVVGRLIPAMKGNDSAFDRGKIADALHKAGFNHVTVETINFPNGPLAITSGRI